MSNEFYVFVSDDAAEDIHLMQRVDSKEHFEFVQQPYIDIDGVGYKKYDIDQLLELAKKVEDFTNNLKDQLDFASISSARGDFNDATRKYWRVKAEVYGELLTTIEKATQTGKE